MTTTRAYYLQQVPVKVRRLLQRCLEKDPKRRLREIGNALKLLEPEPRDRGLRHSRAPWAMAGMMAVALAAALILLWPRTGARPLMRFSADLGPDAEAGARITAAISPDGGRLAFVVRGPDGSEHLWCETERSKNSYLMSERS